MVFDIIEFAYILLSHVTLTTTFIKTSTVTFYISRYIIFDQILLSMPLFKHVT